MPRELPWLHGGLDRGTAWTLAGCATAAVLLARLAAIDYSDGSGLRERRHDLFLHNASSGGTSHPMTRRISLRTPEERSVPLATQAQFLEDHETINQLLQNASVSRRPLGPYFTVRPQATIRFFSSPGRIVHESFVSNLDEVGTGDLFFMSPDHRWVAGSYRLVVNHPKARVELPIELD